VVEVKTKKARAILLKLFAFSQCWSWNHFLMLFLWESEIPRFVHRCGASDAKELQGARLGNIDLWVNHQTGLSLYKSLLS